MSNQVKPEDRELIEAIAEPWICVEERLCEEAVAVHWEEMLTSLTASLATVRREEREATWNAALATAKNELWEDTSAEYGPHRAQQNSLINCVIDALEQARRHVENTPHPPFTAADHEQVKETLYALSDCPTEEESEAVLQACGTSGKEVVNEFIERLLRDRLALTTAIENFIRDRGQHEGEHVFDLNTCSLCDQAYIRAEASLDNAIKGLVAAPSTLAKAAAEEIASKFPELKEHDKWVTLGRVKIDVETETETFERATAPELPVKDQIATIIERCLAGGK